ncbi:MAG: S1C family serine protease [Gaiellaceae bacterium]
MPRRPTRTFAAALTAALGIGAGGGVAVYAALESGGTTTIVRQVPVTGASPTSSTAALSIGDIYKRTFKGVVEITVTSTQNGQFGSQPQRAQGSGFVYDAEGHIVTNEHVVAGATAVSVMFSDGTSAKATVVGSDASTDLAVIKVDVPAAQLVPLALGDSTALAVGDGVVAIGSPFGLEETVTSGIVSALHRQTTSPNNFTIDNSIQTDAAINHGNSGGPLLDTQGHVIGVNAQIESDSGGNDGVGFAIPSATVKSIAGKLISAGKVEHAYLGIALSPTTSGGVKVTQVRSGTPAATAGLQAGDVITAIDGKQLGSSDELRSAVDAKAPGQSISITYSRGGSSHTVDLKLGSRPS